MGDKKLWVIAGPTASGKTGVAISLARQLDAEIISFDARQFFREIPIGTAAPTPAELIAVPHHFIGHKSISEKYSAGAFAQDANAFASVYFERKDHLVAVGGSGMYLSALLRGMDEMPDVPDEIRQVVNQEYKANGLEWLQQQVKQLDPVFFNSVDTQNPLRLIRALEVFRVTEKPFSSFRQRKAPIFPYPFEVFGIDMPREALYGRINQRVDEMIAAGLEEEVRAVQGYRSHTALKTVGYSEFFEYFDGKCNREEAIKNIKQNSRRYAKRQLTWFRNKEEVVWIKSDEGVAGILKSGTF